MNEDDDDMLLDNNTMTGNSEDSRDAVQGISYPNRQGNIESAPISYKNTLLSINGADYDRK